MSNKLQAIIKQSVLSRVMLLALVIMLLQIPIAQIRWLISDRMTTREQAEHEIARVTGGAQVLVGPILTVPYLKRWTDNNGEARSERRNVHLLPDVLAIKGITTTEQRYRGIFEIPAYTAKLTFDGTFSPSLIQTLQIQAEDILWKEATVTVGISDPRAIREQVQFRWDDKNYDFEPGSARVSFINTGISLPLPGIESDTASKHLFSFTLHVGGSTSLNFIPLGRETAVQLQSMWPDPSFAGAYLPITRDITKTGFAAQWKIPDLGGGFGRFIEATNDTGKLLGASQFGVEFVSPVDGHRMSERATKYELLFIFLTFLSFYLFELFFKLRIHAIQYLLVGAALTLFYLLLLSLSEHLGFALSYIIASVASGGLVTGYSKNVLKSSRRSGIILWILVSLYGFLYTLLAAEDYSLLLGSVGLTIILGVVMFLTRNIDWYNVTAFAQGEKNAPVGEPS